MFYIYNIYSSEWHVSIYIYIYIYTYVKVFLFHYLITIDDRFGLLVLISMCKFQISSFKIWRNRCNVIQTGMLDTSDLETSIYNFFSNGKDEKKDFRTIKKRKKRPYIKDYIYKKDHIYVYTYTYMSSWKKMNIL